MDETSCASAGAPKRVRFDADVDSIASSAENREELDANPQTKGSKTTLHVEAIMHPACPTPPPTLRSEIEKYVLHIGTISFMYQMGSIDLFDAPTILKQCCKQISIVDWESLSGFDPSLSPVLDEQQMNIHDVFVDKVASIASWNVSTISVHVFTLSEEEPELEDIHANDDENEPLTACETLPLPHSSLHSLWENLIVPEPIKRNLLSYAQTALLFSEKRVSANIICWNRVLLLHGPAGTGKTSLCRSLAHKLAIRMSDRYPMGGYLMEIHSHSLFSKWFSESGKLVATLFQHIRQMIENEPEGLFCLLVDEVESLATSRIGSSSNGCGEPSDAIRAVNALLTSLDHLKRYNNVIVLTTTNITGSVDVAFVDRADMKQYIGLPSLEARYHIFKGCILELIRVGLVISSAKTDYDNGKDIGDGSKYSKITLQEKENDLSPKNGVKHIKNKGSTNLLFKAALMSDGLSGRSLRRLPFQAHAFYVCSSKPIPVHEFLESLCDAIEREKNCLNNISTTNNSNL